MRHTVRSTQDSKIKTVKNITLYPFSLVTTKLRHYYSGRNTKCEGRSKIRAPYLKGLLPVPYLLLHVIFI
jgi:hypothetical protein